MFEFFVRKTHRPLFLFPSCVRGLGWLPPWPLPGWIWQGRHSWRQLPFSAVPFPEVAHFDSLLQGRRRRLRGRSEGRRRPRGRPSWRMPRWLLNTCGWWLGRAWDDCSYEVRRVSRLEPHPGISGKRRRQPTSGQFPSVGSQKWVIRVNLAKSVGNIRWQKSLHEKMPTLLVRQFTSMKESGSFFVHFAMIWMEKLIISLNFEVFLCFQFYSWVLSILPEFWGKSVEKLCNLWVRLLCAF